MLFTLKPYKRGDSLKDFQGNLVGAIGAFSKACVSGSVLEKPWEVLLVQGNHDKGFHCRLGDCDHNVHEGPLTDSKVSFTLEAFHTASDTDPLELLSHDSGTLITEAKQELRDHIINEAEKQAVSSGLLYVSGVATEMRTYGHTNPQVLNDDTKTFDHIQNDVQIEGWGNYTKIDGETPFVHVHGTYQFADGKIKGGHFIMDDQTKLLIQKVKVMFYPVIGLTRTQQTESFPTWKVK